MLQKVEKMTLNSCMYKIADSLNEKNWPRLKEAAHTLKGASGYVGAGQLHYACYYIQRAYTEHDNQGIINFYPLLVEASIEFKRYSR